MPMKTTERYSKYIKLLLYIAVIVLINIAGQTLKFRADLTKNKIYSLSGVSRNVVATLSEPLTVKVFFTRELPAPHNATEQYLRDMLKEYALHGNKYFNYRFYNVSPETEGISDNATDDNRRAARDYGIHPVQIQMVEQDEIKFKQAFMGLVLIHGDIVERIPTIASTDGLEYKLTTAIQNLNNKVSALLNLEGKIEVDLVLSSSINQVAPGMGIAEELKNYPEQIKKAVEALNTKTYNKLVFKHIDPTTDTEAAKALAQSDITIPGWRVNAEADAPQINGLIGLLIRNKKNVRVIPLLQMMELPIFGPQYQLAKIEAVKEQINANLERLVNINADLGYLDGFGALKTGGLGPMAPRDQNTLEVFKRLIDKTYALKPVSLEQGPVSSGLKCLVIARPTEKFSDYDLYQIDQALMHGTNLAIFTDAFKEVRPPGQQPFMTGQMPVYMPMDTGLEKLLAHYGVRIKSSIVLDENCYRQRRAPQQGGGEQPIYFAPIVQNEHINKELDYIRNIKGLIALKISPLELDPKRIEEQKATAHEILASSAKSWEMRDRINFNPMFMQPPASDKEMASLPLAYLIEGSFTSYFKGKPMPEKPVDKTEAGENPPGETETTEPQPQKSDRPQIVENDAFREESPPAKIFVTASSEFIKDQLLDEEGKNTNSMFVLNVIDALNGRESLAAMRSKVQQFNPLAEAAPASKTMIKAANIAGLPIVVIALGFVVWLRRSARRKRIHFMFQR